MSQQNAQQKVASKRVAVVKGGPRLLAGAGRAGLHHNSHKRKPHRWYRREWTAGRNAGNFG